MGAAIQMLEYVPTPTPMSSANARSWMTGVPHTRKAHTETIVVPDVMTVRENICDVEMLISSTKLLSRSRAMFSRIRS